MRDVWIIFLANNLLFCSVASILLVEYSEYLNGHGNEADFLGVLQKLVPHRSLTLALWVVNVMTYSTMSLGRLVGEQANVSRPIDVP